MEDQDTPMEPEPGTKEDNDNQLEAEGSHQKSEDPVNIKDDWDNNDKSAAWKNHVGNLDDQFEHGRSNVPLLSKFSVAQGALFGHKEEVNCMTAELNTIKSELINVCGDIITYFNPQICTRVNGKDLMCYLEDNRKLNHQWLQEIQSLMPGWQRQRAERADLRYKFWRHNNQLE